MGWTAGEVLFTSSYSSSNFEDFENMWTECEFETKESKESNVWTKFIIRRIWKRLELIEWPENWWSDEWSDCIPLQHKSSTGLTQRRCRLSLHTLGSLSSGLRCLCLSRPNSRSHGSSGTLHSLPNNTGFEWPNSGIRRRPYLSGWSSCRWLRAGWENAAGTSGCSRPSRSRPVWTDRCIRCWLLSCSPSTLWHRLSIIVFVSQLISSVGWMRFECEWMQSNAKELALNARVGPTLCRQSNTSLILTNKR